MGLKTGGLGLLWVTVITAVAVARKPSPPRSAAWTVRVYAGVLCRQARSSQPWGFSGQVWIYPMAPRE